MKLKIKLNSIGKGRGGKEKRKRKKLLSTCSWNPFKLHFLCRNFNMPFYHLHAYLPLPPPLLSLHTHFYTLYMLSETKLAIWGIESKLAIYVLAAYLLIKKKKKSSNLNISVAGGGWAVCLPRRPKASQTADIPPRCPLPGSFLASPFPLTQVWQRRARDGKKRVTKSRNYFTRVHKEATMTEYQQIC